MNILPKAHKQELVEQIKSVVADSSDRLVAVEEAVVHQVRRAARIGSKQMHDNFWTSLSVAASVGALIGFLISSRCERP